MLPKIAQMNKITILLFPLFISSFTFAQSAEELNLKSKQLIQERKFEEALPLVKKSAELGNPEAQYNYAIFLQEGIGIQKNEQESIKWYSKSSDNGFNDGHYAMMMAYGNGQGIEQNSEKAFEYALKCANNNDATCMWNVVNCYLTGNGVKSDISKFKEWIIRLAKLPNPENLSQSGNITSARLELANFYKNGEYFEKDIYQSYLWYLIYNEYKVDFSILKQEEVIKEIKELEKSLTKSQIENAPKDAENLLGRKLINLGELYKNSL